MSTSWTRRNSVRLSIVLLFAVTSVAASMQLEGVLQVTHYDAYLEPKLAARTISGSVTLTLEDGPAVAGVVRLQKGDLTIDAVAQDSEPLLFETAGQTLTIHVRATRVRPRRVTVKYHGAPRAGLVFMPERQQMYTSFSTSRWMVAADAPDARATFHLELVVPRGWAVVANGREVARRPLSESEDVSEWRQETPVPSYTFGFASGEYSSVVDREGGIASRYLANGFSQPELRRVFTETSRMLKFFADKAGVPYPGDSYTQVLVPKTAGQEMAAFAVVSEEYGRALLADPSVVSLLAHELAHQWWGNMVTCRDWTHFWLNEGFATFMAAAYREHRFGREVYLQDVAAMRARYDRVRNAGHDRALVFPNWDAPTADDRTLVYQKGGYVLHLLREALGDELFWAGMQRYTQTHFGQSVTTDDFRRTIESSSGRDLTAFFAEWVYPVR